MRLIYKVRSEVTSGLVVKVYRNTDWNEYVVSVGTETYHTSDRQDALLTAKRLLAALEAVPT